MKRYVFLLLIGVYATCLSGFAQIVNDPKEAFVIATENQRPVLLIFSGSDWCIPCIRFHKEILSKQEFRDFAVRQLVVYKADFPQRRKLSAEMQDQNDELAEKFNPKGAFPYFVLLRPDQSAITSLTYHDESLYAFIKKVSAYLEHEQAKNIQKAN